MKIGVDITLGEYNSDKYVNIYSNAAMSLGLMNSEKNIIDEYCNKPDRILDIGCGSGRVAIGIKKLGYEHVYGVDIAYNMIEAARHIKQKLGMEIDFYHCPAQKLPFETASIDVAIFSFNGLMTIPDSKERLKVCLEINRVLKNEGIFIFTTHDRDFSDNTSEYWQEEKEKWDNGLADERILDYGDRIFPDSGFNTYIHIPSKNEVIKLIDAAGFDILRCERRSDIADEPEAIKEFSDNCVFWIAKVRDY